MALHTACRVALAARDARVAQAAGLSQISVLSMLARLSPVSGLGGGHLQIGAPNVASADIDEWFRMDR